MRFIRSKFTSFGLIGVGLTVFGAVFIEVAIRLHMSAELANLIQALISVTLNFMLNRATTWKDRRDHALRVQVLRYILGKAISIPLNQLFFVLVLGWSTPFIAYTISTILIMFYNFFLGDRFVFGKKKSSSLPHKEG